MATKNKIMENFIFASSDSVKLQDFDSLVSFADKYEEFYEVVLKNDRELKMLFDLLGFDNVVDSDLPNSEDFDKIYDYSSHMLPEFSEEQFDEFYELWLKKTGRESDMDEYGQLVFIQGQASKWNENVNRFVLHAKP